MSLISFPLINPAPFLASCADNITASVILDTTSIAPLWVDNGELGRMGKLGFFLRYMVSLTCERALESHRYYASDWAQMCISLAKYFILVARCVAA